MTSPFQASSSHLSGRKDRLVETVSIDGGPNSDRRDITYVHIPPGRLFESQAWQGPLNVDWGLTRIVPDGAPLFEHSSTIRNVRLLVELAGCTASTADIIFMLRSVGIPDRLHQLATTKLAKIHRLAVWLALARLTSASALVLDNPFGELDGEESFQLATLLWELARDVPVVVVAGPDPSAAVLLANISDPDQRNYRVRA